LIAYVPTSDPALAEVDNTGAPLTTAAVSPFTNPASVYANVGFAAPYTRIAFDAATVSATGVTTSVAVALVSPVADAFTVYVPAPNTRLPGVNVVTPYVVLEVDVYATAPPLAVIVNVTLALVIGITAPTASSTATPIELNVVPYVIVVGNVVENPSCVAGSGSVICTGITCHSCAVPAGVIQSRLVLVGACCTIAPLALASTIPLALFTSV
jgi:hypothetical protein